MIDKMKITPNGSNQTILKFGSCEVLFSYETPVAGFNGSGWFSTEEKFSKTTTKHINKYLREHAVEWKVVPQHYIEGLATGYPWFAEGEG